MTSNVIRFSDVTVAYDRHPAVHHLSGNFPVGSMTAIAGPNGAGKSTLVKALMGQLPLASGSIDLSGWSPRDFGYLPQAAEIDRSFPLTVADTVMLGAWREVGAFRGISSAVSARARDSLSAVGLEGFERRQIGSLSAGQFQRVLFARLLLQDAPVILLDEPFSAIDARTTRELLDILLGWHRDGRTIIAVLHDFDMVKSHFPQTLLIARELVAWGQTASVMTSANLLKARAMAENWDETAQVCERPGEAAA
ncbi:metal ABC transporter ATP-binding protein [Mesorhizobium captivum]|uniref:metal ABC transporter ATP-binding protein n=1 Tax=Mesorhizobium captivum TaxID=3072319 RepID=UPI002A24AE2C|nr:ABC transporter ATP-binding protein [Mesorhizobium sp. VK22E]MDX8509780.1 ABC transporter ATP-binding protein [Mesorhizobium sp. VK22E]